MVKSVPVVGVRSMPERDVASLGVIGKKMHMCSQKAHMLSHNNVMCSLSTLKFIEISPNLINISPHLIRNTGFAARHH